MKRTLCLTGNLGVIQEDANLTSEEANSGVSVSTDSLGSTSDAGSANGITSTESNDRSPPVPGERCYVTCTYSL